jgi:hypothetical protein
MKRTKILYWVFNILFAGFMILTAVPNAMVTAESVAFLSGKLGYPEYFIPFIGVAKILGGIGILIPGYPRLKEWAYAGLTFDLLGATWSVYSVSTTPTEWLPMVPFLILPAAAYYFYRRKTAEEGKVNQNFATA